MAGNGDEEQGESPVEEVEEESDMQENHQDSQTRSSDDVANQTQHDDDDDEEEEDNDNHATNNHHGDENQSDNNNYEDDEDEGDNQEDNDNDDNDDDEQEDRDQNQDDDDDETDDNNDDDNNDNDDEEEEKEKDNDGSDEDDGSEEEESEPDDESLSNEDDDDDDEDESSSKKMLMTEDGREMSEYEILRLERIRRNKEKLAQLGLEGQSGVLGETKKKTASHKKKQRPSTESAAPKRSSLSRRSKGKITHYAAALPSVRQMLKGQMEAKPKTPKTPKQSKDRAERMDRVIHDEFRAIRSHKRQVLRQAERDHRAASKEVQYWKKRVQLTERKEMREQKRQDQQFNTREEEKEVLGGKTVRQLLQEIDKRMPEILEAADEYDEKYEAEARARQRALERFEMEDRMKFIDAVERYPKILKENVSLLSTILVERAPKDPPPPRRSKRSGDDGNDAEAGQPKKKKAKTKEMEEDIWSEKAPIAAVSLPTPDDDPNSQSKVPAVAGKKRKRGVRNVGGWVSPDFAQQLDRAWLQRDTPAEKFDLESFVPQVGDAILYYPKGHFEFLAAYPDVLGKKTRQMTRVPLWERSGENKDGNDVNDTPNTRNWYNDEWAVSIGNDSGGGRYPILCVVQTCTAEFPPDPATKVVKMKERTDGEKVKKVFFTKLKKGATDEIPKIRLAVTLRPLSPVLPGLGLSLPPMFSVVTFPSKLKPFLVPFAWAYSLNHSMQFGTTVVPRKHPKQLMRISKIDVPKSIPNEGRIDSQKAKSIVGFLGDKLIRKESLIKVLSEDSRQLPLCDALVALGTFETCTKNEVSSDPSTKNTDFIDLICHTLPVWDSVTITTKDVYDRKKRTVETVSPWELRVVHKGNPPQEPTPDAIAELPSDRDQSLRMKIESVIDEVIKDHPEAPVFVEPVTEDIAPSYSCAVPIGMSLSRIQKRLRAKSKGCVYRTVGAILSDVSSIVENCIYYNAPDSEVVDAASEVTAMLKDGISRVVREHNKEISAKLKEDEDRRRHVMHLVGSGATSSNRSSVVVCRIRKPFKQALYQDWLQDLTVCPAAQNGQTESNQVWIPQADEEIEYSRSRHFTFVKFHHTALELDQCEVLTVGESTDESDQREEQSEDWTSCRVVWTKAVFPRLLAKKDTENPSFITHSTILAAGVALKDDFEPDKIHVLYWRPCMFPFDRNATCDGQCKVCGLFAESFLRRPPSSGSPSGSPNHLTIDESKAIERSFSLLKKRVLDGVAPSCALVTKADVKQSPTTPSPRQGLESLPSYESVIERTISTPKHGRKADRFEVPPSALFETGFLAHWMSENPRKNRDVSPKQHETISPMPKFCLELVRLRLENGFYRTRLAIENDLIEAFASICLLLVAEAASQKKNPLSVKKVAKLLASHKGRSDRDECGKAESEEDSMLTEWAKKLQPIRDLYSVALAATTDTERFERVNGLYVKVDPVLVIQPTVASVSKEKQSAAQAQKHARFKLRQLLEAVGKDPLAEEFAANKKGEREAPVPTTKLSVICGGTKTQYEKFMTTLTRAVATTPENNVKVKIICDGKEVYYDREVPTKSLIDASLNSSDIKLKVIVNGEEISFPDTRKLGRYHVREVINDFISIAARDLDGAETLSRFLFGRPGRSSICARCAAFRRNFLICRVRRTHANPDFDWLEFFKDLDGGVDDILVAMKGKGNKAEPNAKKSCEGDALAEAVEDEKEVIGDASSEAAGVATGRKHNETRVHNGQNDKDTGTTDEKKTLKSKSSLDASAEPNDETVSTPTKTYSTRSRKTNTDTKESSNGGCDVQPPVKSGVFQTGPQNIEEASDGHERKPRGSIASPGPDQSNENNHGNNEMIPKVDPLECLAKAQTAWQLSKLVLEEAIFYSKAPPRLSRDFVLSYVPIDSEDGHFIYCVICGLSGDLICCDGCPNVVHSGCIGLDKVPDGDFFCEECVTKLPAKQDKDKTANVEPVENNAGDTIENAEQSTKQATKNPASVGAEADIATDNMVITRNDAAAKPAKEDGDEGMFFDITESEPHRVTTKSVNVDTNGDAVTGSNIKFSAEGNAATANGDRGDAMIDDSTESFPSNPTKKPARFNSSKSVSGGTASGKSASKLPFGRFSFDEERANRLTALVKELHDLRPDVAVRKEREKKKKAKDTKDGEESDIDPDFEAEQDAIDPSDPLSVLSDSAKSFLSSVGISTCEGFLQSMTSVLADKLVKWRKKNKLPELRGSGPTAYVSQWKRACKDAAGLEGDDAIVWKDDDGAPADDSDSDPDAGKRRGKSTPRSAGRASKKIKEPMDALANPSREFLKSIGLDDADAFLEKRTTDIASKYVLWRKKKKLPPLKSFGEVATISAWKTSVRNALTACSDSTPKTPNHAKEKEDTVSGRAQRAHKRKEHSAATPQSIKSQDKDSSEDDNEPPLEDPLDALTATARQFLRDERIRSAEEFLAQKSGIMGQKLGAWRKKEGLPKLKGSGEGATISAWKTLAKKAVEKLKRWREKNDDRSGKSQEDKVVLPASREGNITDGQAVLEFCEPLLRRSKRVKLT